MKTKSILLLFIAIVVSLQPLSSQSRYEDIRPPEVGSGLGIHEVEWEHHRDYTPPEGLPTFKGRPMEIVPRMLPPSREIFGYLPYWTYPSFPTLNYDLLTGA
jgi:hypothetical protein